MNEGTESHEQTDGTQVQDRGSTAKDSRRLVAALKWLLAGVLALAVVLALVLAFVLGRLGGGLPFGLPSFGSGSGAGAPLIDSGALAGAESAVANATGLASEIRAARDSLNGLASANDQALKQWDADWERRQVQYDASVAEVLAYNAAEEEKEKDSIREVPGSRPGTVRYEPSYTPKYKKMPSGPSAPAPVQVPLDSVGQQLQSARAKLDAERAAVASAPWSSSNPALADMARILARAHDSAESALNALEGALGSFVSDSDRGSVVDQSRVSAVDLGPLDSAVRDAETAIGALAK